MQKLISPARIFQLQNLVQIFRIEKIVVPIAFLAFLTGTVVARAGSPLEQVKTIFIIGLENHNFTQPSPTSSPRQIFNNAAAPYINSLITANSSNSAQVSFSKKYYNAGVGVHPSEASYVWAEAGTDFGIHTDTEPRPGNNNVFNKPHLARQLNTAGISWKNYQEDVQLSTSPTNNASGTSASTINPYYNTGQYNYAVKHNPMAFFTDTQTQNVFPLTDLLEDLTNNTVGRYNWITPNQFNDQHTALSGGFTYHGVSYTGDQAAIAQGDNFLSILIPKIMASSAYKDNGLIIIRWDESEGGDTTSYTLPAIIISPLAKGNAYASNVELNHSSVLKSTEEIFGLSFLNNAIPASETNVSGSGYNTVSSVNDLSDMFLTKPEINVLQSGVILTNQISVVPFGNVTVGSAVTNTFAITNSGSAPLILSNIVFTGANASDFSLSGIGFPTAIGVGGSANIKVRFAPAAGCSRFATMQISNNDTNQNVFTLSLDGFGIAAPSINTQPASTTNFAGTTATFSVEATACTPLSYQWFFGANPLANETNSTLSITSVGPANVGSYFVRVSASELATNSASASLVVAYQAPTVMEQKAIPASGEFQLKFTGPDGQTYRVLASDDLTIPESSWDELGFGTFGETNVVFTDSDFATHPKRFYVIKSP